LARSVISWQRNTSVAFGATDGPDVFAGHTAIYFGVGANFSDNTGLHLPSNQPTPISANTAAQLVALSRQDIFVSEPT
jgi:hypothetical protein